MVDFRRRTAVANKTEEPSGSKIYNLKKTLIDSLYGTDRGLRASSETRAKIVELITQLEAKNQLYTSFMGLFPLFPRGTLPLVKVEEISQSIDSSNFMVENVVQFTGPLATTTLSTNAKFEIQRSKCV
uniref:Plastid lipid-associated protein/fibrillin conserved domain-containing protein n=1 Tax=Nelumbo nucifera TaxID=4432 RepID=A0A822XKK5_NELNU|nr:TPA_asm: hypothetical protein HUJ06_021134 [Nelumbo nucifera]